LTIALFLLFNATLFDALLFNATLFDALLFNATLFDTTLFDTTLFNATLFDTTLFNASLFDATLFNATLFDATLFDATLFDATLFNAMLFNDSTLRYSQEFRKIVNISSIFNYERRCLALKERKMKIINTLTLFICLTSTCFSQKADKSKSTSKPFVLGEIVEMESKILSETRILNIYLPEGYNPEDSIAYPVIYLLDGSADEDFIHVVGLVQFYTFPWINAMPKSIVVGIATVERKRDFTYPTTIQKDKERFPTTGGSANFIGFIENELQPFIMKKYKTTEEKTIIGQSLGGLVATEILLKKPTLFSKYIIISPSLWWDDASLLKLNSDLLSETFVQETVIYLGVGKEGLAPTEIPHVMEVDANLLAEKLKSTKSPNVKVYFDYLPDEDHATISHQAISNAIKLVYAKTEK